MTEPLESGLSQQQICQCFNHLFAEHHKVYLRGGGAEPEYIPPIGPQAGWIIAREDFAASALHEAAHWCVAGASRRSQYDYGYVYTAPPRDAAQQRAFFQAELRVQACELVLTRSAGRAFQASADDPDGDFARLRRFQESLEALVARWDDPETTLLPPPRAVQFAAALEQAWCGDAGAVHLQQRERAGVSSGL